MIDWSHVAELRTDMGESFDEVVEVFLMEVEEGLGKLDSGSAPAALAADLHFLKGAALNLGFREFAGLCATGEHLATDGAVDQIDLDAIRDSFAASRAAFIEGLPRLAA